MADIPCRDPNLVMRLARLGSIHQTRLSFMRQLTRRMAAENWGFERTAFQIDDAGVGHAVYTAHGPERSYSLVAFAHDLPPEQRSDRVIAEAWDATFTLFDGLPSQEDIQRLSQNIPKQEAGRVTGTELAVSRANRSVRLWEHVVTALAQGQQPDAAQINAVGYLTRWFVTDLVQHMANTRAAANGEHAAKLAPALARSMGIGNSTGLGMAPFLLNHPVLFNNWMLARERALQVVRGLETASDDEVALFLDLFRRSAALVDTWQSDHPIQIDKLAALRSDIERISNHLSEFDFAKDYPWNRMYTWAEVTLSLEGQEWIASLMLEPYGALIDDLSRHMSADNTATFRIAGAMQIGELRALLADIYDWAIVTDWTAPENKARAWYVSEEKLEPRLGERFEEPIEDYEQPLAPGRDAALLYKTLSHWPDDTQVANFLLRHPEYRHMVRRVQIVGRAAYAEIRDNTISAQVLPIDMLRCKLAFFGATKFDPRSDRWVRICMYGNAPLPFELKAENADFWVYPQAEAATA